VDGLLTTTTGLWLAVVASGLYHGVNPGMGWPLAVSAGLMGRGRRDVAAALVPLAGGHLLAMLVILLPFGLLTGLLDWQREIRIGASLAVIAFGVSLAVILVMTIVSGGDAVLGELPFTILGFLVFFVVFWLMIAWIF